MCVSSAVDFRQTPTGPLYIYIYIFLTSIYMLFNLVSMSLIMK